MRQAWTLELISFMDEAAYLRKEEQIKKQRWRI